MDTEKRIRRFKRVRIAIMRSNTFLEVGPVMMLGKKEIVDDIPTACTNGRDEKYGAAFVDSLNDKELGFVILHENYGHKMCRHLTLYRSLYDINPKLANMACDYWINNKLIKLDPSESLISMPRDEHGKYIGLYDPKYDNMSVIEIFRLLQQEQEQDDGEGQGQEQDEGQGQGQGDGGLDSHDWDAASGMSKEEQDALAQDIEQAIRQGQEAAKKAGKGGLGDPLGLNELLAPKVDWRKQLRQFVQATCRKPQISTWRRPNKRLLSSDVVMPSLYGKSIKELVMACDASGSMFYPSGAKSPFTRCMSEVGGLVKQLGVDKLHLLYWDGHVCGHETYTSSNIGSWATSTKPKGGGGTNPSCIPKYIRDNKIKADAVIVLTDGEVPAWGAWSTPVLWAITSKTITAPVGKTIRLED